MTDIHSLAGSFTFIWTAGDRWRGPREPAHKSHMEIQFLLKMIFGCLTQSQGLDKPPGKRNASSELGGTLSGTRKRGLCAETFPKKNLRDIARKKTEGSEGNIGISNMESALKLILVWQQHAVGVLVADAMCVYNIRNNHV